MNIIIVHHHQRPPSLRPIRGGALRAHHIGVGLQHYGHNISYLGKDSGSPSECWNTPRELRALCSALDPDIIIATQLEDVDSLSTLPYPIIVDLYAQRLMESSFDGTRDATVLSTLKALSCGVLFLVSNPRQRWSWLSTLVLAGVSLQHDPILVIPLCTEDQPAPSPPEELTLIGGGVWWPWQDPWPSLKRALEHLSKRQTGKITWYGGPPNGEANPPFSHPRFRLGG
ncbi:MAG: hypothetical protein VX278_00455, partial [Myxococcota bacterium]|nr:hypothetical protein [Myxococcota bacterium]